MPRRRTVKETFTDPKVIDPLKQEFAVFANKVISGAVESGVAQVRSRMRAMFKGMDAKLDQVQRQASTARDEDDDEGRQH